jgi:hypothetical protein
MAWIYSILKGRAYVDSVMFVGEFGWPDHSVGGTAYRLLAAEKGGLLGFAPAKLGSFNTDEGPATAAEMQEISPEESPEEAAEEPTAGGASEEDDEKMDTSPVSYSDARVGVVFSQFAYESDWVEGDNLLERERKLKSMVKAAQESAFCLLYQCTLDELRKHPHVRIRWYRRNV